MDKSSLHEKITAMTREQMKGVGPGTLNFSSMSEKQYLGFLKGAKTLHGNKVLKSIIDTIIRDQVDLAINQSIDFNQTMFARFTINGASLVYETIERLSGIYDEKVSSTTVENQFDVI